MNRYAKTSLFKPSALLLALFLLSSPLLHAAPGAHGPNGEHLSTDKPAQGNSTGRQADGSVLMPMSDQRVLGLRTLMASESQAGVTMLLNARVSSHPAGRGLVQASSDGRFESSAELMPVAGQQVKAGQLLGYIRYQDTAYEQASQTSQLIALRSEADVVRRELNRLQKLGQNVAEQTVEQLSLQLKSVQSQAAQLEKGLEKPEPLFAPVSGVIQQHHLSIGQRVTAGEALFEIIDPSRLLVEASSLDAQLSVQLLGASLKEFPEAKLQLIGAVMRYQDGAVPMTFSVEGALGAVPNQPVTLIAQQKTQLSGIRLPASAVVMNSNNQPQVWIKLTAERFLPQRVQLVELSGTEVMITHGLGADNRVVVQGATLLNQVR
jgi:membrane fusion protein, heavy metal efflux system